MCAKNSTHIQVARTSNNRVRDLYCCLLPQCEALRACRLGFPIATVDTTGLIFNTTLPCSSRMSPVLVQTFLPSNPMQCKQNLDFSSLLHHVFHTNPHLHPATFLRSSLYGSSKICGKLVLFQSHLTSSIYQCNIHWAKTFRVLWILPVGLRIIRYRKISNKMCDCETDCTEVVNSLLESASGRELKA